MAVELYSGSLMASNVTPHTARCVGDDHWVVSWLPGRTLSGDQAVAAMSIASALAGRDACGAAACGESEWAVLDSWALALGLTAREAAHLVANEHHALIRASPMSEDVVLDR